MSSRQRLDGGTPSGGSNEFRSATLQAQALAVATDGLFLVAAGMTGFAGEAGMVS